MSQPGQDNLSSMLQGSSVTVEDGVIDSQDTIQYWLGIQAGSAEVLYVTIKFTNTIPTAETYSMAISKVDRPLSYRILHDQFLSIFTQKPIHRIVIASSVVIQAPCRLAYLETAEVRGVLMASAAASNIPVIMQSSTDTGKNLGARNLEGYSSDPSWWINTFIDSRVPKKYRKIALLTYHAFQKD